MVNFDKPYGFYKTYLVFGGVDNASFYAFIQVSKGVVRDYATIMTIRAAKLELWMAIKTYIDKTEVVLVGREHVRPDVLLQLRGIPTLQNKVKHLRHPSF